MLGLANTPSSPSVLLVEAMFNSPCGGGRWTPPQGPRGHRRI